MPAQSGSLLAARRGKLLLLLLCAVQFLDVADSSIMNVALPSIRRDLGFSVQGLQWVLSGLSGHLRRAAAARRPGRGPARAAAAARVGHCAVRSLLAGRRPGRERRMLVGARLGRGAGAAMMAPAGLSILTTSFNSGDDRNRALGSGARSPAWPRSETGRSHRPADRWAVLRAPNRPLGTDSADRVAGDRPRGGAGRSRRHLGHHHLLYLARRGSRSRPRHHHCRSFHPELRAHAPVLRPPGPERGAAARGRILG